MSILEQLLTEKVIPKINETIELKFKTEREKINLEVLEILNGKEDTIKTIKDYINSDDFKKSLVDILLKEEENLPLENMPLNDTIKDNKLDFVSRKLFCSGMKAEKFLKILKIMANNKDVSSRDLADMSKENSFYVFELLRKLRENKFVDVDRKRCPTGKLTFSHNLRNDWIEFLNT